MLNGATSSATIGALCVRDSQGAINLAGPNGAAKYEGSITATTTTNFTLIQSTHTSDLTPNSLTIQAQSPFATATAGNRKPGDINLAIGAPTNSGTTDGFVNIKVAGSTRVSLGRNNTSTNALISFVGSGEITAVTSVLVINGSTTNTTFNSTDVTFSLPTLQFAVGTTSPIIKQADNTTNSATAQSLTVRAANATGTSSTGGDLILKGGSGTLHVGNIGLFGTTASAGGGEGVLCILNRTVAPSTNPTNGGIIYSEGGALKYRGSSGTVTVIAPA